MLPPRTCLSVKLTSEGCGVPGEMRRGGGMGEERAELGALTLVWITVLAMLRTQARDFIWAHAVGHATTSPELQLSSPLAAYILC